MTRVFAAMLLLLSAASLRAQTSTPPFRLRLLPLLDGLAREKNDTLAKEAAKVGLDLTRPSDPVVALGCANGRLFYVFSKVTEEAFGDRAWMIQRIRKVERTWEKGSDAPMEKVTWQVEAFKTIGGTLKGSDQHFGSFGLRDAQRREIVKEYEIGFGNVPGTAEGVAWPFDNKHLFHMLQEYGSDATLHDAVKFTKSMRWSLTVSFAADGSHRVHSPELGIDLPKKKLGLDVTKPVPDAASKATVLVAGVGLEGVTVGTSARADVDRALGEPLEDVPSGPNNRNCSYRGGLTCNFTADGVLNTVITRPSFGGRTKEGVAPGMPRAAVRQKLGAVARDLADDAATWTVPGLLVHFDAAGTVTRIVVSKRQGA